MEDIFEEKICSVCKNHNSNFCPKNIQTKIEDKTIRTFCLSYVKDQDKIIPYEKPLIVTAKRAYINEIEY